MGKAKWAATALEIDSGLLKYLQKNMTLVPRSEPIFCMSELLLISAVIVYLVILLLLVYKITTRTHSVHPTSQR